jgi:hypothetical protein
MGGRAMMSTTPVLPERLFIRIGPCWGNVQSTLRALSERAAIYRDGNDLLELVGQRDRNGKFDFVLRKIDQRRLLALMGRAADFAKLYGRRRDCIWRRCQPPKKLALAIMEATESWPFFQIRPPEPIAQCWAEDRDE